MCHGWGGRWPGPAARGDRSPGRATRGRRSTTAAGATATPGLVPAGTPPRSGRHARRRGEGGPRGRRPARPDDRHAERDPLGRRRPAMRPGRIGLWGSSYSGGHVVYVAARDPRVKAIVSQVAAIDSRWVVAGPAAREHTFGEAHRPRPRRDRLSRAGREGRRQPERGTDPRADDALRADRGRRPRARTAPSCSSSPRTRSCSTTGTTASWPTSGRPAPRSW